MQTQYRQKKPNRSDQMSYLYLKRFKLEPYCIYQKMFDCTTVAVHRQDKALRRQ